MKMGGPWCVNVSSTRSSSRNLFQQRQALVTSGATARPTKDPLPESGQPTLPATGRDNVRASTGVVSELSESNVASATPVPRPQGIDVTGIGTSLTSGARSPIPDLGFSPQALARMPRLAHGIYLLPPCTLTYQQRCICPTPKLSTERDLYIEKEAEFRRCRADYAKAEKQFGQMMRDLSLFDALMQAPDHERSPPLTRLQ